MPTTYAQRRLQQILAEGGNRIEAHRQVQKLERLQQARLLHVYVFPAREFVKIGIAGDPHNRWRKLHTGNPLLEAATFISPAVRYARSIELAAHLELATYRVGDSEWFKCNRHFAAEVVQQLLDKKQGCI